MEKILGILPVSVGDLANYIVYAAIAIVTIIGVFKCLLPLWTTTHALRRAIRRLQDDAGNNSEVPVWQEKRFMGRRLKGSWVRFLQNAEQLDRRGLPCNVEDYINDDTVTHGPGNAQLAELIPSLLTSLGILGTFMGMTSGLSGLDPTSTESMMSGIKTLLGGMQFAFGTSVAGVSCSLIFNMTNRIAQGSSYRAIDDFVESFTQLAMQRPLDNDVQLICQNQDRNHLLNNVTDTLTTSMSSSIENAITHAMSPIAASMDQFLVGATRAQVDGVGRIVNNFINRMNASMDDQLLSFGHTLADLNQQQILSNQQMQISMQSTQQFMASVQQLHGISQDLLAHFEHYISTLTDARQRDGQFESNAAALLDQLKQTADQQMTTLQHIQAGQEKLDTSMTQYEQADADSCHVISKAYETFVKETVEELNKAVSAFDCTIRTTVGSLGAQLDRLEAAGQTTETISSVSELQRLLADIQRTLEVRLPNEKKEA